MLIHKDNSASKQTHLEYTMIQPSFEEQKKIDQANTNDQSVEQIQIGELADAPNQSPEPLQQAGSPSMEEEIENNQTVDLEKFHLRMNTDLAFVNSSKQGFLNAENVATNKFIEVVEIYLKSTGESIYQSNAINPSEVLRSITLSKPLSKGKHSALAVVRLFTPNTKILINKIGIDMTINVLN